MVGFFFFGHLFFRFFFLLVLGGLKSGWWHASADGNVSQFTALIQTEISQNNRWMDWREILCRRSCSPEDESDRLSWSCDVFLEHHKQEKTLFSLFLLNISTGWITTKSLRDFLTPRGWTLLTPVILQNMLAICCTLKLPRVKFSAICCDNAVLMFWFGLGRKRWCVGLKYLCWSTQTRQRMSPLFILYFVGINTAWNCWNTLLNSRSNSRTVSLVKRSDYEFDRSVKLSVTHRCCHHKV